MKTEMFNDHGREYRTKFLRECPPEEIKSSESKVKKAKDYLGKNWVMHPDYVRKEHPSHTHPGSYHLQKLMSLARSQGRIQ